MHPGACGTAHQAKPQNRMPSDQPQHFDCAVRQLVRIRIRSNNAHTKVRYASEKVIANVLEQTSSPSSSPRNRECEAETVIGTRLDFLLLNVASWKGWNSHDPDCSHTTWLKLC